MKTFHLNCYEAYTNSDLTEGRGVAVHIGYFTDEDAAIRAAEHKGPMGTSAWVRQVDKVIKVFEDFGEFEKEQRNEARARGLSKLTQEEREALGLAEED